MGSGLSGQRAGQVYWCLLQLTPLIHPPHAYARMLGAYACWVFLLSGPLLSHVQTVAQRGRTYQCGRADIRWLRRAKVENHPQLVGFLSVRSQQRRESVKQVKDERLVCTSRVHVAFGRTHLQQAPAALYLSLMQLSEVVGVGGCIPTTSSLLALCARRHD